MRLSRRFFWSAIFLVLIAALAAAPRAVKAQDANPATQPEGTPAQLRSAARAEQAELNHYIHAPQVDSVARVLHIEPGTASQIFLVINLLILVLIVGIPLGRLFPRIIRRRSQTLEHNLEVARKETEDANARLSAVEARLASLDQEIAKYRAEVEQEMAQDEARIKTLLEEEKSRVVSGAEQEINAAAAQARRGLRAFAAELAVDRAASQLKLTPEADQALIAEFVHDVAGNGASRGGKS